MTFSKICFITSLIGDDFNKIDKIGHFEKNENYNYYCFTNFPKESFDTSWEIINIDQNYLNKYNKNITKSRFIKFQGWKYIKDVLKEDYDFIIYCDGIMIPILNRNWEKLSQRVKNNKYGFLQKDNRVAPTIDKEFKEIVKYKKDTAENIKKTREFFISENVPLNSKVRQNNIFIYHTKNENATKALDDLWDIYSKEIYTHRDQPFWAYICYKNKFNPIIDNNFRIWFQKKFAAGFNGHKYV